MNRKALLVTLGFLSLIAYASSAYGVKVWLTPKRMGGTSEVIPLDRASSPAVQPMGGSKGALYLISYDTGSQASSLGGLREGYHIGVWFQSPAACTLLEIHYDFYHGGAVTYYVADPADTIDFLNDYYEYHGGPNPSGPNPREFYLHPEESRTVADGWDTLGVAGKPDVGTNIFYAAYIMNDGNSSPYIDAGVPEPWHTLMYRIPSGGTEYGWYTSWHHAYIRALVDLYENAPPAILSYDRLPDTYLTVGREVTCHVWDIGVPIDSSGADMVNLYYWVNSGVPDTLPMTLISGDSTDGTWSATIPGRVPLDTVNYYINATDLQGDASEDAGPWTYVVRAGQASARMLFVNDDYYGDPFSYDPVAAVVPDTLYDFWDAWGYGVPDSSVIFFPSYTTIIINAWDGTASIVPDVEMIKRFLDSGGNLFLAGQDIIGGGFGYGYGSYECYPGEFCYDYLHILSGVDDAATDSISVYYGVEGDVISGAWHDWPLAVYPYNFVGPGYNYSGTCVVDDSAVGVFYDTQGKEQITLYSQITGFRYEGTYKLVFLYWPFAYLVDVNGVPDSTGMETLVKNIMTWFGVDPGVEERPGNAPMPVAYILHESVPNPMKNCTAIRFALPRKSQVSLTLYDMSGRLVTTLAESNLEAGSHTIRWDGRDSRGSSVTSGVYFYRMSAGDFSGTRKMVVLR